MRILWAENHTAFARLAGRQFLAGHDLVVLPSVAAAIAIVGAQEFDAVLVDYDLDDGKGTEVVKFVRRLAKRLAIVATSSHDDGNAALIAAGADTVCPKTRFADIAIVLAMVMETRVH